MSDTLYYCKACGLVFYSEQSLRVHIANVERPQRYTVEQAVGIISLMSIANTELEKRIVALEAENERLRAGK